MKPALLILSSVLLLSCGKAYYATISSNETSKNDLRELEFENDSVKIIYRFDWFPGTVDMTIVNKLSIPLEVNWKKSAFIIDDQPSSFYSPDLNLKGDVRIDTSRSIFRTSRYSAKMNGVVLADEATRFLPPQTRVSRRFEFSFPRNKVKELSYDSSSTHFYTTPANQKVQYKRVVFERNGSPFQFRSFITLNFGSGSEVFLDHRFYISEIWRSRRGDGFLFPQKSGDHWLL